MGTVIGYTAARMQQIEDSAIVNGGVVLDNLILTRHDGTEINAGNVRGPQGIQGPAGDVSPVGVISMFGGAVAPVGWHLCDGSSLLRSGAYAALFSAIGTLYGAVDGTHFNVPDFRGRVPVGVGSHADVSTIGNNDGTALSDRRIKHSHSVNDPGHIHAKTDPGHSHAKTDPGHTHTGSGGSHSHSLSDNGHSHSVNDNGHSHSGHDPGHAHTVYDPGHTHQEIFGSAALGGGVPRPVITNNQQLYGSVETGIKGTGIGINGAATGIYYDAADANVSVNSSSAGVSIGSASTSVSVNSGTTGIAYASATTGISYASALTGLVVGVSGAPIDGPSFLTVSYIIKV